MGARSAPTVTSAGTETGTDTGTGNTADLTKPVAVLILSKQRLARALKRGLGSKASTTEAGKLVLDVLYRGTKVATARRSATGAGSYKLVARFSRKGRRALGRLRSAKLTLRLTVTDGAGNKTVKKKTVKLKR